MAAPMCYSARVQAEFSKFRRETGAEMDIESYIQAYWWPDGTASKRPKAPRAMEHDILEHGPEEVAQLIRAWDAWEQDVLTQELFAQRRRVVEAERALQSRDTKKAREDVRIGSNKVAAAQRGLDVLKGAPSDQDHRIFPGVYCPVLVSEDGRPVVRLMRYQCRPAGKPALQDHKFPGTYNARRDNLEGFWGALFGRTHGVMIAHRFYEHVEVDGQNTILEFLPRTREPMLVACLWSRWTDPTGVEPDLLSFAAVTDDPEPEVAAAGHDRTIINLKPENVDEWLNPSLSKLPALHALLDDKQHPYYEHRRAA